MILCGTYLLIGGELSLLTFVMFLVVGSRVFDPLTSALTNFAEFRYFSIAGGRILTLMNESEMKGNRDVPESGDITFDHVSFGYQEKEILHDISVTLRKGTLTALVGPSGSGKSTMLKLCARFYDPHKGSVRFNGMDMKELELESLMKHCSMVFQDVVLFDDTVMENIRLGKRGATDEEVRAAAEAANCGEFIRRLPQGYDTPIGENGAKLSGGERQRISIARALLKNAPIVLLDEATASLDVENETKVQGALSRLLAGKTVLVIAHRMRTVAGADHIVVLENGHVAEQGTPAELMERGGLYRRMVELQSESARWKLNGTEA